MVVFAFRTGKAFLKDPSHPITIPKKNYSSLEREGLNDPEDMDVRMPDDSRMCARVYRGNNNWGLYYQIKFRITPRPDTTDQFRDGDRVAVVLRTEEKGKETCNIVKWEDLQAVARLP